MSSIKNLCWIRRDLRLNDHAALSMALKDGSTALVFVFDKNILEKLDHKNDRRITFIIDSLIEIEEILNKHKSSLHILYGDPVEEIPNLAESLGVQAVYSNRDYEPYAKKRDDLVGKKLKNKSISFYQFKDSVIFEKNEVLTKTGSVYKVFTPYKNRWLEIFDQQDNTLPTYNCDLKKIAPLKFEKNIIAHDWYKTLKFINNPSEIKGGSSWAKKRLNQFSNNVDQYDKNRDYPSVNGTSLLSTSLRFGTISIRELVAHSLKHKSSGSKTWLSELIWRDFYQMILDTHPFVVNESFKREYDKIKWPGKKEHFRAWCEGQTGFPIIDAAMRCFNETGMMHNRLRMIVASFLCKILHVDWRLGEEYFAQNLLDFDLAANNGGWQWSSSSGCDAQPYFRIFNPYSQSEKFDTDGKFIKKWCPELKNASGKDIHEPNPLLFPDYPVPIVSYEQNRIKCLEIYAVIKK